MTDFVRNDDGSYSFGVWQIVPDAGGRVYADQAAKAKTREWWIGKNDDTTTGDAWIRHTTKTLAEAREWVLTKALADAETLIDMFDADLVSKFRYLIWQTEN